MKRAAGKIAQLFTIFFHPLHNPFKHNSVSSLNTCANLPEGSVAREPLVARPVLHVDGELVEGRIVHVGKRPDQNVSQPKLSVKVAEADLWWDVNWKKFPSYGHFPFTFPVTETVQLETFVVEKKDYKKILKALKSSIEISVNWDIFFKWRIPL